MSGFQNPFKGVKRGYQRALLAHVFSYPIGFAWAVASIPLTIHLSIREIDQIGDEQAIGQFVARRVLWPAGVAFTLAHLLAIPWIFSKSERAHTIATLTMVGMLASGALSGAASWLWLFLR